MAWEWRVHCFSQPIEFLQYKEICWCPLGMLIWPSYYYFNAVVNVIYHISKMQTFYRFNPRKHFIHYISPYIHTTKCRTTCELHTSFTYRLCAFVVVVRLCCAAIVFMPYRLLSVNFFSLSKVFFPFCPFWFRKISQANCVSWELFYTRTQNLYEYLFFNILVGFARFIQFCLPDGNAELRLIIIINFFR